MSETPQEFDQDAPILIEFNQRGGVRQVALSAPETVARSAEAVSQAMGTIRGMAERVRHTVTEMAVRPDSVEVEFGIKFDAEAGAVIAKTGVEAAVTVKLAWGPGTQG
ncbi:CU044_2847 family protein [Streptomyces sp. NPDC048208]|uniref:CU044_2847 family protein n=1 Tax=Streptomyces sp. NPDC048208 TaxID=3365515 RepID=UPI003715D741